jgi:monothiol glutaredoxin
MSALTPELKARFDAEVKDHHIVVYMKGNQLFPQCGFSARVVAALQPLGKIYSVNVLEDASVREGIKAYSNWPTIPQVYINGQFIGGSDIIGELQVNGELEKLVKSA